MRHMIYYDSPIGRLGIAEEEEKITDLFFTEREDQDKYKEICVKETPILREAKTQLEEYFNGQRKEFDLPLNPKGTEFQKRDWQELCKVPYGITVSYGQIAKRMGNPKAARAVGLANNRNPIAIVIPCHRIIGADGRLVGYGGGLDIKKALLDLEGCTTYREG